MKAGFILIEDQKNTSKMVHIHQLNEEFAIIVRKNVGLHMEELHVPKNVPRMPAIINDMVLKEIKMKNLLVHIPQLDGMLAQHVKKNVGFLTNEQHVHQIVLMLKRTDH